MEVTKVAINYSSNYGPSRPGHFGIGSVVVVLVTLSWVCYKLFIER